MAEDTNVEQLNPLTVYSKVYPNKNLAVRRICLFMLECAVNASREASASQTTGIESYMAKRQKEYITAVKASLDAEAKLPVTDAAGLTGYEVGYPIDMTEPIQQIKTATGEGKRGLNEDVERIVFDWVENSVQFASSNTAGMRAGIDIHDRERLDNNLDALGQLIDTLQQGPKVDFAATAEPGARAGATV